MAEKLEEVPSCQQYHADTKVWLNRTATCEAVTITLFTEEKHLPLCNQSIR